MVPMTNLHTVLLVAFAAATGALSAQVFSAGTATAQTDRQWRECLAADLRAMDGDNPQELREARRKIAIPPGWTPVGGGGGGYAVVILCR